MADSPIPAILCIGEDEELLLTRAAVLRRTGAEVKWVRNFDALQSAGLQRCDVVVICHSVSNAEARKIFELAHRRRPPAMILQLKPVSAYARDGAGKCCDAVADVAPAELLCAVQELLERRGGGILSR